MEQVTTSLGKLVRQMVEVVVMFVTPFFFDGMVASNLKINLLSQKLYITQKQNLKVKT